MKFLLYIYININTHTHTHTHTQYLQYSEYNILKLMLKFK